MKKTEAEENPKYHLLVVDEDKSFYNNLKLNLTKEYKVEYVLTDVEAWNILIHKKIDCVFCDTHLGLKSGIELLKKCKSHRILAPFVMMTNKITKENITASIRNGALHIFEKPIDISFINSQLKGIIESGENIQKIKHELNSVITVINPNDAKNMKFVEDYLIHTQMYKKRKAA